MKMCNEMVKLRAELDKRGISWEDKSSIVPQKAIKMMVAQGIDAQFADSSMFRTHFNVGDYHYSVIYGYGSYGGYDPITGKSGSQFDCCDTLDEWDCECGLEIIGNVYDGQTLIDKAMGVDIVNASIQKQGEDD